MNGKTKQEFGTMFERRQKKMIKEKSIYFPFDPLKFLDKKFKFNGRILDFGCLKESFFYKKTLREKGNYKGFDLDLKTVDWLKKNNFYADFWNTKEKFDLIISNHVYEHMEAEEREKFIARSYELLNKNGKLIMAFPNIINLSIGLEYWTDRTHKLPPSPVDEAYFAELFGFKSELFFAGLSFYPLKYFSRLIANFLLGFNPLHNCIVICTKN